MWSTSMAGSWLVKNWKWRTKTTKILWCKQTPEDLDEEDEHGWMTRVRNQEVHSIPHPLESNGQKWEVESCSRYLARDIEGHVVQLVCIRLEVDLATWLHHWLHYITDIQHSSNKHASETPRTHWDVSNRYKEGNSTWGPSIKLQWCSEVLMSGCSFLFAYCIYAKMEQPYYSVCADTIIKMRILNAR